ncbi:flagellar hook assembly protein FlgD [Teredinibacter sp. KSP-S5-2]|uniref:flagellar hook assembly protein FlgD n=1 Tax=Teredinibacter sp. KSP-S5-2 TaxID=3034506 RepID=UPI0029348EB0|nr:flagellar hook assembly protein FlgD [Teredinibacter sp. KSP-S5-2]WNO07981.1 flagellar hook assembly protein FlgD [Teredinibacter sp. KSP-S5-2]
MTEVSAASNNVFSDYAIKKNDEKAGSDELGQKAFLQLMITQLENQDPLSPQDNTEFISQLAQFSSVESLDSLNNSFDQFANSFVANQALQASTLVGRSVSVPSEQTMLVSGGLISASVDIPASTGEVRVNIYTDSGELVDQISLGEQPAGELVMRWDGLNAEVNGDLLDWTSSHENGVGPGIYKFEITASIDSKPKQLQTALSANVNSVTVGADGQLTLNLAGVGPVSLSDVKQFNE